MIGYPSDTGGLAGAGGPLRIIVVGQNELIRRGICSVAEHGGLEIAAEAASPAEALTLLRSNPTDAVVLDYEAEHTRDPAISDLAGACPLLVLVSDPDAPTALAALFAGARGCVSRSSSAEVLIAQIMVAVHGEIVVAPAMADHLIRTAHAEDAVTDTAGMIHRQLTPREVQVLRLVANGWDNATIGATLFISPRTVKNHIASILEKLGLENRIQAAVWAVRGNVVDEDVVSALPNRQPVVT
jgi:DNA-binding NarL/FixJ family response regulator